MFLGHGILRGTGTLAGHLTVAGLHKHSMPVSDPWRTVTAQHTSLQFEFVAASVMGRVISSHVVHQAHAIRTMQELRRRSQRHRWSKVNTSMDFGACTRQCPSGYIKVPGKCSGISFYDASEVKDEFTLKGVWDRRALGQAIC